MRLEDGEKIIFRVHPHWLYVAVPEFCLAILGVILFTFGYAMLLGLVLILFATALPFAMLIFLLDWLWTNYYLTNLRLIEERDVIGKRIAFIPLKKVQDVKCRFGILGRILGFGDLEIESAGTRGKIVFEFLPQPRRLKEEISRAISGMKANVSGIEGREGK